VILRGLLYFSISGGDGICSIIVKESGVFNFFFPYTDHLGSILTVTDVNGSVVAEQNFDAWGRKRNVSTWDYVGVQAVPDWLYRGYTGHEHLPEFGLINMNARLYDPVLGRMLSSDNFVGGGGSQGFNRYSYANNNPLNRVDPDGNFWHIAIGAAVSAGIDLGVQLWQNGGNFGQVNWTSVGISFISGGVGAAVGLPVGNWAATAIKGGNAIVTGAIAGAITGAAGGAVSGTVSGLLGGLVQGQTGNALIQSAVSGTVTGAIGGAIGGAISGAWGGITSSKNGKSDYVSDPYSNLEDRLPPNVNGSEHRLKADFLSERAVGKTTVIEIGDLTVDGIEHVDISKLTPTHPISRSQGKFKNLVDEIRLDNVILEPIKVTEWNSKLYIVNGNHRYYVAPRLGINVVPIQRVNLPYRDYKTFYDLIYQGSQPGWYKYFKWK
jgi:RHS repeat-associated protein